MSENTSGLITTLIGKKGEETLTINRLLREQAMIRINEITLAKPLLAAVIGEAPTDHDTYRALTKLSESLRELGPQDSKSRQVLLGAAVVALNQYAEMRGYQPAGELVLQMAG